MHCLHTVTGLERNLENDMIYLVALLHDIGKLDFQVRGKREDDTDMHYYGHPKHSAKIVEKEIINMLQEKGANMSLEELKRRVYYVRYYDDRVSLRMKHLRRH